MSIDATRWAWEQPIKANLKIVLLSLADRADQDGYYYLSTDKIGKLVLDASQSEDDIKKALKNLEKLGLIAEVEDNTYFLKRGV